MKSRWIKMGILLILFAPSIYYQVQQWQEDKIVKAYLDEHGFSGRPADRETALALVAQVRQDFNIKESTFTTLKMQNRPFLRESAGLLLQAHEGLCGEGTRVLVNLLDALGYDATRVSLYNKYLHAAHTLESVLINGEEFLLDSINSSAPADQILREEHLSTRDFAIVNYDDNPDARREAFRRLTAPYPEQVRPFFEKYPYYSYEAVPASKLLSKLGVNSRVLNFERPPRWISILAEKPHQIMAVLCFVFALCVCVIWVLVSLKAKAYMMRK